MDSFSVRAAEQRDRETWVAMRQALWPDAAHEDLHAGAQRFFAGDRVFLAQVLVAERGREKVGMIELSLRSLVDGCYASPVPFIEGWFVTPQARRQGIGTALVRAAEDWARAQGCTEIASDALIENQVSEAAHKSLGFEEVDRVITFRKSLA